MANLLSIKRKTYQLYWLSESLDIFHQQDMDMQWKTYLNQTYLLLVSNFVCHALVFNESYMKIIIIIILNTWGTADYIFVIFKRLFQCQKCIFGGSSFVFSSSVIMVFSNLLEFGLHPGVMLTFEFYFLVNRSFRTAVLLN